MTSLQQVQENIQCILQLFSHLDLLVNKEKLLWIPPQRIELIGAILDFITAITYVPLERFQSVLHLRTHLQPTH